MYSTRKTLEKLFISKVRIKVLKYFIMRPDQPIHLRAAVREFNEEINAVRRELERLESVKILLSEKKGNRKYFVANREHPYFEELMPIFHKAYGLGGEIVLQENRLGKVEFAFLTNAYTKNVRQGLYVVDLMMIGDVSMEELSDIVDKIEKKEGREIHYTVLKSGEFALRKKRKDPFVMEMLIQPKIMLIGDFENMIAGIS
jgi:hypothetical protein